MNRRELLKGFAAVGLIVPTGVLTPGAARAMPAKAPAKVEEGEIIFDLMKCQDVESVIENNVIARPTIDGGFDSFVTMGLPDHTVKFSMVPQDNQIINQLLKEVASHQRCRLVHKEWGMDERALLETAEIRCYHGTSLTELAVVARVVK